LEREKISWQRTARFSPLIGIPLALFDFLLVGPSFFWLLGCIACCTATKIQFLSRGHLIHHFFDLWAGSADAAGTNTTTLRSKRFSRG